MYSRGGIKLGKLALFIIVLSCSFQPYAVNAQPVNSNNESEDHHSEEVNISNNLFKIFNRNFY